MRSFQYIIVLFLTTILFITGCNGKSQQAEPTITPENANTVYPTETPTPAPTGTPQPTPTYTFSEIVNAYVDGELEIDFNSLSKEEYAQYSVAITDELNHRVEAPIHFYESSTQVVYFNDDVGKLMEISASEFKQRKSELKPKLYIPAKQDDDGNWMYLDININEYVKIENSADFDFEKVIDEKNYNDGTIEWYVSSDGEKESLLPRYIREGQFIVFPAILNSAKIVDIPVQSTKTGNWRYYRGITLLIKKSYGFEQIYIINPATLMRITIEGEPQAKFIVDLRNESERTDKEWAAMIDPTAIYYIFVSPQPYRKFGSDQINWENLTSIIDSNITTDYLADYDEHQHISKPKLTSSIFIIKPK